VFADLGFPDAAERQAKLRLAYALNQLLEGRKLSQADVAKVLGLTRPICWPIQLGVPIEISSSSGRKTCVERLTI
jgi:hypothetical protein